MNAEVLSAFELLRAQAGREQGRVVDTANLREWFACAFEKAMIKNFRWHDCRDRFCSKLAMKGVNLKAIQTLAGHKTIAMSARYAHLSPDVITAAFERMVGTLTA
jgi:site-specific recombinase XerD